MISQPNFALLTDQAELVQLAAKLAEEGKPVGFDIETGYEGESREKGSLRSESNFVTGISFTNSLNWARYVPVRHDSGPNVDNTFAAAVFWLLLTAIGPDGKPLGVAHHAKFERRTQARWFLKHLASHPQFGPDVIAAQGYIRVRSCTMLESYVEGANRTHGLKDITFVNYGIKMTELLELFPAGLTKKEEKSIRFNVLDQEDPKVIAYACDDSHKALMHHMDRYPRVKDSLIYRTEMAVLHEAACVMEDTGLDYDWNRMREAAIEGHEFADRYLSEVQQDFEGLLGRPLPPKFNFGSSQQLQKLLYDEDEGLGLPVIRRTRAGKPSTEAKTALKGLSKEYPAVKKLLNWKGLTKLWRDFLAQFEAKYSWAPDGRAHPSLLQHGTVTGRTSKAEPNDQQSPKIKYHYELADGSASFTHNFRDNIRAPQPGMRMWWQLILSDLGLWKPDKEEDKLGWYIIGFDYSQIELRVVAGEAGEEALLRAFANGEDVHCLTASLMLTKDLSSVTEEDRDVGKTMNFALVYGMTEEGLAERLGISKEEAEELFARFHAAYPRIKKWMEKTVADSKRLGYVKTRFGRTVRIWEYEDADTMASAWFARSRRAAGERTAGNAPIQGAATGDYKKISMVQAQLALQRAGLDDKVLLCMDVHDALEWYAREDVHPSEVVRVIQPAVVWDVEGWPPMVAEWHIGERLGSLHKLHIASDGSVTTDVAVPEPIIVLSDEDEDGMPLPPEIGVKPAVQLPEPEPVQWLEPPVGTALTSVEPGEEDKLLLGEGRTVIVTLDHGPALEQVQRFVEYLEHLPGGNTVILRLPDQDVTSPRTCGLHPGHAAEVSLILGGAMVSYDLDSVDLGKLSSGLL